MKTLTCAIGAVLLALVCGGCSKDDSTTTSPSTTSTSPTTVTFASQLAVKGSTSRSFTMTTAGAIRVTLVSLGNGSLSAGVGVGVQATSAPCSLAVSVVTAPGSSPQIVTNADPGTYCVQLFDVGRLTQDVEFSVTVEHP
jgi:hypothetical protein